MEQQARIEGGWTERDKQVARNQARISIDNGITDIINSELCQRLEKHEFRQQQRPQSEEAERERLNQVVMIEQARDAKVEYLLAVQEKETILQNQGEEPLPSTALNESEQRLRQSAVLFQQQYQCVGLNPGIQQREEEKNVIRF